MKTPASELSASTCEELDAVVVARPDRPELTAAFSANLVLPKDDAVKAVAQLFSEL
ncbi:MULTISPECIES: hypothetical protein [Bradyrhizobium]|uniref:hypothetical protein n=1 Tax=Bradyrhizobium TaxID=374 RepID=UPI0012D2A1F1|nr:MULTISPECIES: hypothetical protein [Bradyrhizobium]